MRWNNYNWPRCPKCSSQVELRRQTSTSLNTFWEADCGFENHPIATGDSPAEALEAYHNKYYNDKTMF